MNQGVSVENGAKELVTGSMKPPLTTEAKVEELQYLIPDSKLKRRKSNYYIGHSTDLNEWCDVRLRIKFCLGWADRTLAANARKPLRSAT